MKNLLILLVSIAIFSCNNPQNKKKNTDNEYALQLIMNRIEKDKKIKDGQINIFNESDRENFEKLNYYKPNTDFIVKARVEKYQIPETISLNTSDGQKRIYLKFGLAIFKLNNKEVELILLKDPADKENKLFLSFTDGTSGEETYGAGRYLDIIATGENIILDFNLLYNPYCAYNDAFSCPLPPKGNNIDIKILAGEKNYKEL